MGKRRTKAEINTIREAMYDALREDHPMSVRQVFYRMTILGVVPKTEAQYKNTVCRLLADMRREGVVPYSWIADSTRWVRQARTYSSMEQALWRTAQTYRRALWDNMGVHVEVWLEKEALAGVLYQETEAWDIPLYVTRGYPSLSYLHTAGEFISSLDKPTVLYYFGDHDPSGVDIARKVEAGVLGFVDAPDLITFERVAVVPWQIEAWELPTRPTKKTDSRSKNFKGESVEVDAIPPKQLRALVRQCAERHMDPYELERIKEVEQLERETLETYVERLRFEGH